MFTDKDGDISIGKIIVAAFVVVIILILGLGMFTKVPVGSTGVVVRLGEVTDSTLSEGLHFKVPFIEDVVDMNNKIQKLEVEADSSSKDLQPVISTIALNFHLSPEKSAFMYQNVGVEYTDTLIQPVIQESCKNVMARYSAEQLVTQRSQVGNEIAEDIADRLVNEGIMVDKFNITNFSFNAEFNKSIEEKQIAEQEKIKNDTLNSQSIAKAAADAEVKRQNAQADADAEMIKAEGRAKAIEIEAQAQAEANEKISKSLTLNILQHEYYEKWDGVLPKVNSGGDYILSSDIIK